MREIVFNHPGVRQLVANYARVASLETDASIGVLREGRPVGGFLFTTYLTASIQVHMAGLDERWCSRSLLTLVFDYAFNQLGVRKVVAPVPSDNPLALQIDIRGGFQEECRLKDVLPQGDVVFLTMTREQCRWLNYPIQGFTRGSNGG